MIYNMILYKEDKIFSAGPVEFKREEEIIHYIKRMKYLHITVKEVSHQAMIEALNLLSESYIYSKETIYV